MQVDKNILWFQFFIYESKIVYISSMHISFPLPQLSNLKNIFLAPKANKSESSVITTSTYLILDKYANYASAS